MTISPCRSHTFVDYKYLNQLLLEIQENCRRHNYSKIVSIPLEIGLVDPLLVFDQFNQKNTINFYFENKSNGEAIAAIDTLDKIEISGKDRFTKSEEFIKIITEAESLSLSQTIQNINEELEEFISAFFGDNFTVSLTTFKQTKDGDKKPMIDIQIIKDGEVVPLDGLSGGEYDRVSLAFFLAFNKSSKCNIILLDECLASLHPELVEEIVEMIKERMNNKLVMFTLHQANTGIFDEIIDVCKYRCFHS
jgi:isochorismate synthase EntC